MRLAVLSAIAIMIAGVSAVTPATAGSRSSGATGEGAHPSSKYYRKGTRVRGYSRRVGGYSYTKEDTINTFGDSRSNYGGATSLRDSRLDRQTTSGPFDHGFFFDSGIGSHGIGGNSPYMN